MFNKEDLQIIKSAIEQSTIKGSDAQIIAALILKIDQSIKNSDNQAIPSYPEGVRHG